MDLLQSFSLEHLPTTHTIHITLYRDVENASFLHQQLLAGNTDFEYALIDATVVSSELAAPYFPLLPPPRPHVISFKSNHVMCIQFADNLARSFQQYKLSQRRIAQ